MATRCCWPPESWPGRWWPRSPSPTRSSSSVALAPATRRDLPASRIGATTLPWAVRLGIRLKAWKTTPTVSRRCAVRSRPDSREVSRPSSLIDPAVGVSSPARQESRVVFPQPDGPRRTTSSPSSASKVSPSKGRTTYPPEVNSTVRSRTSSALIGPLRRRSTGRRRWLFAGPRGSTAARRRSRRREAPRTHWPGSRSGARTSA